MGIRVARMSDAKQIRAIYAPYVQSSGVTFETEIPTLASFQKRIKENLKYGWFVFEVNKNVVGYAYASSHRERKAYQWSCEISVYIAEKFHHQGIAQKLYLHLLKALAKKNLVNVYAGITLPNKRSVKFHEAMGFKSVGVYHKIGYKAGRWHDVGWWELSLNKHKPKPKLPKLDLAGASR